MSIYVARSPYRSSLLSRSSRIKIGFPKLAGLKKIFVSSGRGARRRSFVSSGTGVPSGVARGVISGAERKSKKMPSFISFLQMAKDRTQRLEFGPSTVIVGLIVIAVVMSLAYLLHFNRVATKGYDLRRLEAARQELMTQYDIKNMKLAQAKSLNTISGSDRVSAMRKPGQIIFVHGNTVLAVR